MNVWYDIAKGSCSFMIWEDGISHHAHRSLSEGRRNNRKTLPLTEDVVKLTKRLQNEVKERKQNLLSAVSTNDFGNVSYLWVGLAEVLLTQLVVFNRKRPGEVSRIILDDYRKCSSGEDSIVDSALSKWEVALCKCLWRVEIVGKRWKTVVVLLTATMKEAMDTLVENREVADV
ncbi:hypothetical protein HOLleu_01543 [Holothuria leucospilota]|uniref:Uncharacterized protein n=1 Tax=Holothuria leucospilota TaxID=206669 RepID=A0A9Q1HKX0_HOLLE|nr:hypothetical protein HOLleu_01543 [Holothuria leucospilota]